MPDNYIIAEVGDTVIFSGLKREKNLNKKNVTVDFKNTSNIQSAAPTIYL